MSARGLPLLDGLDLYQHALTDRLADVIRIALGDEPASPVEVLDGTFVRWAISHGVRAEIAAVADTIGADDEARKVLETALHQDQRRALTATAIARRVVGKLAECSIDSLVLKGVALSVQRGGVPTDRPGTDLDLLVRPADRVRAHRVLVDAGFSAHPTVPVPGNDGRTRYVGFTTYETLYVSPVIHLDLHWRLGPVHIPALVTDELLTRRRDVDVSGVVLPTLHPDDALAHLVLHGAKDRWISLRSVVDIALLLQRSGASWPIAVGRLPRSHAPATARAALDWLTTGRLPGVASDTVPSGTELDGWVRGVVERPMPDDDHRPAEGYRKFLVHRIGLSRSPRSAAAVATHLVLPSTAIARSRLPVRWWWLTVFARPFRIVGRLVSGSCRRVTRRRSN